MKTLLELLDESLNVRRSLHQSPNTLSTLRRNTLLFFHWLKFTYQVFTADRLRKVHLHAYQKHLYEVRTRYGLPLKPNTVNGRIKAVKSLLRYLKEKNYPTANLEHELRYVKTPSMLPTSVLSHGQIRQELNRIDTTTSIGYRDRTIIELLYSTGIRNAELIGIQIHDVDLTYRCVKVCGKGAKERFVPIGKTAMRYLETYIRGIRPFLPHQPNKTALWINRRGNPLSQKNLNDMILARSRKSTLSIPFTPHTFRRSCATELIRSGANPYHVKELLGHASVESLAPYTKLTINDLKKTHAKCHPREKDE